MEASLKVFRPSRVFNKLDFTKYCGDGDNKSYKDIVSKNVYPGYKIKKRECTSHVQKKSWITFALF